MRYPESKKILQRYLWFVNYYKNYIPRMAEKFNPFYKLLRAEVPISITSDLKETFVSVNKPLSDACERALEQSISGKQLVLMTDARFRSAGYALKIENKPDQKIQSKRKSYAPVAFESKVFFPRQLKMSVYSKIFLAIYMAFFEFAHIVGGNKTNNCSDGQQIGHPIVPDKSHSTTFVSRMSICAAVQL